MSRTLVGGLLAHLGLLLAFSLSAAWNRFDERLGLAIDEANVIGTVALRLDVGGPSREEAKRKLLADVRQRRVS